MRSSMVLIKKEFMEIYRTYKIYVVPIVLLIFGFMSPLLAKYMPVILKEAVKEMQIVIPEPTGIDAWGQFLKNMNQMGCFVVILTSMGLLTEERLKGTTVLVLTKPVSKTSFVLSKFFISALLITASIFISYLGALYYTDILFDDLHFKASMAAAGLFTVFCLVLLAFTLLASAISKSIAVAGGISITFFAILSISSSFGGVFGRWSPGSLSAIETRIIAENLPQSTLFPPVAASIAVILVSLTAAVKLYKPIE